MITDQIQISGQNSNGFEVHSQCDIDVPDICRLSQDDDDPTSSSVDIPTGSPISIFVDPTSSPTHSLDNRECTASDTNWEVDLQRTYIVDLDNRHSTCFEYRFSNHDRNYALCSDELEYWMLSINGDRTCPLHSKLTLVLPAGNGQFDVVLDDPITGMHGYRWKGAVPQKGQFQDYTLCVEGDNVESNDGIWAAVGTNGFFTRDGMVSVPAICSSEFV